MTDKEKIKKTILAVTKTFNIKKEALIDLAIQKTAQANFKTFDRLIEKWINKRPRSDDICCRSALIGLADDLHKEEKKWGIE